MTESAMSARLTEVDYDPFADAAPLLNAVADPVEIARNLRETDVHICVPHERTARGSCACSTESCCRSRSQR